MSKNFEEELIKQVSETKFPLKKLNRKKILVTGCNGFIPSAFIKILAGMMKINGYKIHSISISTTFNRATSDEKMSQTMVDFCDYFAEKLELKK